LLAELVEREDDERFAFLAQGAIRKGAGHGV